MMRFVFILKQICLANHLSFECFIALKGTRTFIFLLKAKTLSQSITVFNYFGSGIES